MLLVAGRDDAWGGYSGAPGIGIFPRLPEAEVELRALADGCARRTDGERCHMERVCLAVVQGVEDASVALQHDGSAALAENGEVFDIRVGTGHFGLNSVADDKRCVRRENLLRDFCGAACDRCLSDSALFKRKRVGTAVVDFDKRELGGILCVRVHEKFADDEVVLDRGALDGREREPDLQVHVLGDIDGERNFTSQRFNLEVRNRRLFVKVEGVVHAEDGGAFGILHRDVYAVFAVKRQVVARKYGVIGIEFHGVGELFISALERHDARCDSGGVAKAKRNLDVDESGEGVHGNLQGDGGTRLKRRGDFALLHQGPIGIKFGVKLPVVAREQVQVEALAVNRMDEMQRIGSDTVENKAVEKRSFAKADVEGDMAHFVGIAGNGLCRILLGVVCAVAKSDCTERCHDGANQGTVPGFVFLLNRTHKTSLVFWVVLLYNTLFWGKRHKI